MELLKENWPSLLILVYIAGVVLYCAYAFLRRPTNEQIKSIKEWLLYAVIEAEKQLGSGTGQLQLRYVYNMFIERFDWIAKTITFESFSGLVDESLSQMKKMLETNKAVLTYVEGIQKGENEND